MLPEIRSTAATAVEPDPMNLIDLATNHNSLCCVGQKFFLCALYSVWHGWLQEKNEEEKEVSDRIHNDNLIDWTVPPKLKCSKTGHSLIAGPLVAIRLQGEEVAADKW